MADIGSVLGGRYRLIELLGQGGMATIYRARDSELERDVAVKLLRPEYGRDPDFLARFRQEAQSAASLSHPNIVAVFDYGQDAAGPFIVMELIDGEDLASVIRRTGAFRPDQAARLTAQVAHAIEVAHRRGIIHRDIKPGNIMVARDGRLEVTDFGIARAVAEAQMTMPGTTLGSVHYFSPEQARGEATSRESDVYSLGIVLFELLTGRRPWEGDSAASIAMARLSGPPPSAAALRPGIPPDLDAIARRAMAPRAEDRYRSAGELAQALDEFLARSGGIAAPGPSATSPATLAGAAGAAGMAGTAVGAGSRPPAGPSTVASGVARPNAGRPSYVDDAYADAPPERGAWVADRAAHRRPLREDEDRGGSTAWVWLAGLLALAILVVVGFLVAQLLSAGDGPIIEDVSVPNLVGLDLENAQARAEQAGLTVRVAESRDSEEPPNEVLEQDPPFGEVVEPGTEIEVVVARGVAQVSVPNVVNLPEPDAIRAIVQADLEPGDRSETFHPTIPEDTVAEQSVAPGTAVDPGTRVDYVVSLGPEPTPTPTLAPTPSPTPPPTPPPTPEPTPEPTPTPTPEPELLTVDDYRCLTVDDAVDEIEDDGFSAVVLPPESPDEWFVSAQNPAPGAERQAGSEIVVTTQETLPPGC